MQNVTQSTFPLYRPGLKKCGFFVDSVAYRPQ